MCLPVLLLLPAFSLVLAAFGFRPVGFGDDSAEPFSLLFDSALYPPFDGTFILRDTAPLPTAPTDDTESTLWSLWDSGWELPGVPDVFIPPCWVGTVTDIGELGLLASNLFTSL